MRAEQCKGPGSRPEGGGMSAGPWEQDLEKQRGNGDALLVGESAWVGVGRQSRERRRKRSEDQGFEVLGSRW